ncbi:MAG: hypothetical protein VW450_00650 [Chloroflexota bacterium]
MGLQEHAHGDIPSEAMEEEPQAVAAFLRVVSSGPGAATGAAQVEPGFRTIMFTDLVDLTALTARLGDGAAMELLSTHNALLHEARPPMAGLMGR